MNALLAWIKRLWQRGEAHEVPHGAQLEEWEREEGVPDDSHPHDLDDLR